MAYRTAATKKHGDSFYEFPENIGRRSIGCSIGFDRL